MDVTLVETRYPTPAQRSSFFAASKNDDRCAGVGYRVSTSVTSIVRTLFGSKPVSTCLRASRRWRDGPEPAGPQARRQRDFAHDQQAARADADRTVAAPAFFERVVEVGPACAHGR